MKSFLAVLLSAAIAIGLAQTIVAAQLGDPAAPLQITTWTKGQPVDLATLKGKQVAVVEFWATWCPPCRASIPHLTELQKKYTNIVFIGVSDEDPAVVKKFVAKMGDKMDYTVAVDDGEKTSDGYMKAYGIDGIPHAFVVGKDGTILWNGHPMGGLEEVLEQISAGKYDLEKEKKITAAQAELEQFVELASKDDQDPKLGPMGRELEALDKELGGLQPGEKFDAAEVINMVRFQKLAHQYGHAAMAGQDQATLDDLEKRLVAVAPKDFDLAAYKADISIQKTFTAYYHAATSDTDKDKLADLARKVEVPGSKNARMLNDMAMAVLTDENIKIRDFQLATWLAHAAVDASGGKDAAVLDTYARALFENGKAADAVDWQKKAVAAAESADERQPLQASLKKYQDAAGK